jgi:hypothetical protein
VSRWRREYQKEGNFALRSAGRAGRLPNLSEADKARLIELLLEGPERLPTEPYTESADGWLGRSPSPAVIRPA